ncbi:MAG TPA: hypothetical protein VIR62_01110 [Allosphingosinicella sp.]
MCSEGWCDAEARLSPDGKTLYFSSERLSPAHPNEGEEGWNNGKYNIWSIGLDDARMAAWRQASISE